MISSYDDFINSRMRIFISSTFDDMYKEREVLVHSVFPRLRADFSNEIIDIIEVDLRWGITDENIYDLRILETCIREVLHCKPFFIGIIGKCYGSLATENEINNLPPAYLEAIGNEDLVGKNMTELEIRAGVFIPNNKLFSVFL